MFECVQSFEKLMMLFNFQIPDGKSAENKGPCDSSRHKGCPPSPDPQFFLTLFKKPLTPPPRFEHHVANFFDGFLKKRVNVCRDKIRQNNA